MELGVGGKEDENQGVGLAGRASRESIGAIWEGQVNWGAGGRAAPVGFLEGVQRRAWPDKEVGSDEGVAGTLRASMGD